MSWRVEVDDRHLWLYPNGSDDAFRLDPGEAWDLGDELHWGARTIWGEETVNEDGMDILSTDVDVAQHAEGEHGDADADPAVPEAKTQPEAVADAHGGSDQVQDDGQHQRWVLPGDGK